MTIFDIKSTLPTTEEAKMELMAILHRSHPEKIIKIIHGYGSTGVGGKIKKMTHQVLKQAVKSNTIRAFIPGEATTTLMGYDEVIYTYRHLLKGDTDFHRGNDGITYVIF